ncbi:Sapep family Mn(2+)-dependent dipeptidase [Clostridium thermobutyricum]|uniref:Sapep family Mn(2+)-dependent dipeptidase n=1 Tax=Clostridium thermobutyricum TaxID=29372 RepID=UPI002942A1DC|nr:Sapep family Mn(2+)-dependent dipeptidase [Clostridium thermobutyricum]
MAIDNLKEKFKNKILSEKEELFKNIDRLIRINSVEGESLEGAPFGVEPKKALEEALKISEEMGFKTKNIDNAIGYAEYGEGEEYICVIGHVDIVPVGEGWSYDPLKLTITKDKLYGRGILDNKGPIMSALYGLKILKDLDITLSKKVRIIFGTNEETGFKDIPYYLKNEKPPIMGFTPDCKYPAVYGERGILDLTIWSTKIKENISIEGEFKNNVVPSYAKININGNCIIEERGKQAPGNAPEIGENAVTKAFTSLSEKQLSEELKEFADFIKNNFHENHYMEKSGVKCEDEISGKLVINPYKIEEKDSKLGISVVFRYPITYKYEDILKIIDSIKNEEYDISINRRMDSVCFPLDSKLLKELKKAYEDVTGEDGTPVTTTGGTYAKVFPNIVAFGPSFPGQKGIAHNKDEYMDINDLLKNTEIFTNAIYNLAK